MKTKRIEIKVSDEHHKKIIEKAENHGFTSLTDFILFCCLSSRINVDIGKNTMSIQQELSFYSRFRDENKISDDEFNRIKAVLIAKLEKNTVKEPGGSNV